MPEELIKKAISIAENDLRSCYKESGIVAGLKRFDDYWARDAFFASLGAAAINDLTTVKNNFSLFLNYQKKSGQLARRIDRFWVTAKYLGLRIKRNKLKPRYTTALGIGPAADQNSLFIISLCHYFKASKDKEFLEANFEKIKKAIDWNFSLDKDNDNLLEEGYLANWEDTIMKRGKVLYTNVLHYWALVCFAEILELMGKDANFYRDSGKKVKEQIDKIFWLGNYYAPWLDQKLHSGFIADGNLLAIISGLADESKAEKILKKSKELANHDFLIKNIDFKYPLWQHFPLRIFGASISYQTDFTWLWLSCLLVLAQIKAGQFNEARENLGKIAQIIVSDGRVYEVYYQDRPVKTRLFSAEAPFAWSAGLFLQTAFSLPRS